MGEVRAIERIDAVRPDYASLYLKLALFNIFQAILYTKEANLVEGFASQSKQTGWEVFLLLFLGFYIIVYPFDFKFLRQFLVNLLVDGAAVLV